MAEAQYGLKTFAAVHFLIKFTSLITSRSIASAPCGTTAADQTAGSEGRVTDLYLGQPGRESERGRRQVSVPARQSGDTEVMTRGHRGHGSKIHPRGTGANGL